MPLDLRGKMFQDRSSSARPQQLALLHLVFPDTFEGSINKDHKEKIAQDVRIPRYAAQLMTSTASWSRFAAVSRQSTRRVIHFYEDDIRKQWDPRARPGPNPNLWDDFVRRAREFSNKRDLDSYEVDYKLEIGGKLAETREAVLAGAGNWADLLKGALKTNEVNFVSWRLIWNLNQWCAEHPDDALTGLQFLWTRDAPSIDDRIRDFCELMPVSVSSGVGTRTNVVSALLMGLDVEKYPPFQVTVFDKAYEQTGYPELPEKDADEAAQYEHALGFLDRFMEEAKKRRLDACATALTRSRTFGAS